MAITPRGVSKASLSIAAAMFSILAMAQPAPPNEPNAPPPSTTPAPPPPEPPQPFSEADPATKPAPIDINPQDVPIQQPGSIKRPN